MRRMRLIYVVMASLSAALVACRAPTSEQLYAQAQAALAEDEPRTAEIHLKNLLEQSPNHLAARALLGELLVNAGDSVGAEHSLQQALALGADPAAVHLPLLRALLAQGKFTAVIERIAAGPTLTGEDEVTRLIIAGSAHRALRDIGAAEAAYRAALELEPQSLLAKTDLAGLYVDSGRLAEARPVLEQVHTARADYVPAVLLLGRIDSLEGRLSEAERWFQEAVRLSTANGQGGIHTVAMAQLVETQVAQGKLEEANANVDGLLALDARDLAAGYLKARIEVEQGDLDGAEQRLETVVAGAPAYWPAYTLLGRINAAQEQLGQAAMYLQAATSNNPLDAPARLLLAEVYVRQNNLDAARELFQSSGSLALSDGLVIALAGRSSLQEGRRDLAAEFFERSERTPPANVRELLDLSSIFVGAGEIDRAVRLLETSSFDLPESDQLIAYALTLVQLRRGDAGAAAATAARLAEQREPAAWLSTLRGTIATLANDLPAAQGFFDEALGLEPSNVPALLGLARVAVAQGRAAEGASHLRRVVELEPQHANAILVLAALAIDRGDFLEASSWLSSVPESAARLRLQGDLELQRKDYGSATAAYRRGFDLAPSADAAVRVYKSARLAGEDSPAAALSEYSAQNPRDPDANFALGSIALDAGDQAAAIARYEAVLAANPNHPAALNNLAWIYSERGDVRALDLATRARAVLPNDPSVADTLGWLHVRRGDAAEGLPLLEEAVRANPDHPEIRYHWAVALAETGNRSRAEQVLDSLLRDSAEFPSRTAAEERRSQLRAQESR